MTPIRLLSMCLSQSQYPLENHAMSCFRSLSSLHLFKGLLASGLLFCATASAQDVVLDEIAVIVNDGIVTTDRPGDSAPKSGSCRNRYRCVKCQQSHRAGGIGKQSQYV